VHVHVLRQRAAHRRFHGPTGLSSIVINAYGAGGHAVSPAAAGGSGGSGGEASGTLAVTAGEVLQVDVGAAGGNATRTTGTGGFNGGPGGGSRAVGGAGGNNDENGAAGGSNPDNGGNGSGGGGASDVRPLGRLPSTDLSTPTAALRLARGRGFGCIDGPPAHRRRSLRLAEAPVSQAGLGGGGEELRRVGLRGRLVRGLLDHRDLEGHRWPAG